MDLAKSHWVAMFGHMGVGLDGLDIFSHRYYHKSIDDTVEHAKTCVSSSLLEGSPAKFFQHRCNTRTSAEITCGPASCSPLYLSDLGYIHFGRGVSYGRGMLQLGPY